MQAQRTMGERSPSEIGSEIEGWALEWFRNTQGGRLLERNFRVRSGEIDLIFEQGEELVFVEVRGRPSSGNWVDGLESLTFPKLLRLSRAIRQYLAAYRGPARSARLDLLAWDGRSWRHARNLWPLPGSAG
jgi:putative endonuclease